MLLVSFTLSALAVVGAVGWLGRTGSPLMDIAAVALLLVLTTLVLVRLVALLPDRPRALRYPIAFGLVPGLVAAVLLVPLGISSAAMPRVLPSSSPAGTVRGFLGAVVDNDGVDACRYLTNPERVRAAQHACQAFFGAATLWSDGRPVTSDAQLDGLSYRTHGSTVTVDGRRFVLVRATPAERTEFLAPPTPWRIASNVRWLAVAPAQQAQ
jgi:hypothetical protein